MNRLWIGFLTIMMAFFIAGCGGGTTGNGNTVFITASAKSNASLVAFPHYSSNGAFVGNQLSYTIKSTPYTTTGTVKNSDVNINKIYFKYTPVTTGAPVFVPVVASKDYGAVVSPNGSLDLDISVISAPDFNYILANSSSSSGINQYKLEVTFAGTEVNTGTGLSTAINSTVFADN